MDFFIDRGDGKIEFPTTALHSDLNSDLADILFSVRAKVFNAPEKHQESSVIPESETSQQFHQLLNKIDEDKQRRFDSTALLLGIKENTEAESLKLLDKSKITPGFENLLQVPAYDMSDKQLKKLRDAENKKTKGKNWFNLPATEKTPEIKKDLQVLKMRSALDPKQFYKKNDMKVLPKYFHIGKVVDSPLDFYNGRLTKKERKKTLVGELQSDPEFQNYSKRKFKEAMEEKTKKDYKAYKKAKKLKRKKK